MDRAAHLERLRKCTDSVLRYSDLVLRHASADQRDALLAPARRLVADYAQLEVRSGICCRSNSCWGETLTDLWFCIDEIIGFCDFVVYIWIQG